MKQEITYSHLDDLLEIEKEVEEEIKREKLEKERLFLQLLIHEKTVNSPEYKRLIEISHALNIKMVALSKEECKQEIEDASKLITERDFEEIAMSYDNEKKYVQLLKGYKGYDNEWKLYTRTNVNCFNYYFHKAKFIMSCYFEDYQYCMNVQYKYNTKFLDPNMKNHYDMVKSNRKISGMTQEEFEFRLEYVRLLNNAYSIPELAEYTELIQLYGFCGLSEKQLAEYKEINIGSVENDLKKLYKALAHVLEDRDKNYITGKAFFERRDKCNAELDVKDKLIELGKLIDIYKGLIDRTFSYLFLWWIYVK